MASGERPHGWSGADQSLLGEYYEKHAASGTGERLKLISGLYNTAPQSCAYVFFFAAVAERRKYTLDIFFVMLTLFFYKKKVFARGFAKRSCKDVALYVQPEAVVYSKARSIPGRGLCLKYIAAVPRDAELCRNKRNILVNGGKRSFSKCI